MGDKYRYLFKNIGLMTISNFSSKILSFLLVPLYTSVLSTEEYGTYDLYTTTAFLLMPLFSICVSDATLRYTLERHKNPGAVLSISIKFYIRACLCITVLIVLNTIFSVVPLFNQYPLFFLLYYYLCLLSDILTQFARGLEKISDVAISGILSSITTVTLNILLLLVFSLGLEGYFIANCSAFAATIIYLVIRLKIWKYIKMSTSQQLKTEMERYSAPLIFNQIGWWINNVSDRYVVTWLCGTAANGVYSVAYKIPSMLSIFQTIFNQAWTLSTVRESKNESSEFYLNIYKYYNCGLVILCSVFIAFDRLIARILFASEFYQAWRYAPFLLISVVFVCLSGFFEGILVAAKKTDILAKTTIAGAGVNTVLNIIFVYIMGPIGAAIATLISYFIVWAVRMKSVKSIMNIKFDLIRNIVSYCILTMQALCLFMRNNLFVLSIEMIAIIALIVIYANNLLFIIEKIRGKIKILFKL